MLRIVRRPKDERLLNPFHLRKSTVRAQGATQLYWLGYIAASGRVFLQGAAPTLVLTVDRRDVNHVLTLVEDLCAGHPTCEWCESNHDGLQAYIRDRELTQMLAEYTSREDSTHPPLGDAMSRTRRPPFGSSRWRDRRTS
ncbi:MAG: hypothetical protein AUH31_07975 [Armatimonadetes bacterium 13_1_40CM_64_14]|nr:MAG: hypothetical protein AUH31_07975 [Armatimonadetes bacterium 13_1_40CM_64_14]